MPEEVILKPDVEKVQKIVNRLLDVLNEERPKNLEAVYAAKNFYFMVRDQAGVDVFLDSEKTPATSEA